MKISRGIALASLMTLAASPVFAGFSLDDVTKAASSMQGGNAATAAAPTSETAGLLQAVTGLGSRRNKPWVALARCWAWPRTN